MRGLAIDECGLEVRWCLRHVDASRGHLDSVRLLHKDRLRTISPIVDAAGALVDRLCIEPLSPGAIGPLGTEERSDFFVATPVQGEHIERLFAIKLLDRLRPGGLALGDDRRVIHNDVVAGVETRGLDCGGDRTGTIVVDNEHRGVITRGEQAGRGVCDTESRGRRQGDPGDRSQG